MGFGDEIEAVDVHQGSTNRFSVRLKEQDFVESSGVEEEFSRRPSSSNLLIGERGGNLVALEYLLKRVLRKKLGEEFRFALDLNDYRMRRLEDLKQDVKSAAKEARTYQRDVPLRPMSSFERRIVHLLLAEYPDITTESIGAEPERRVVIKSYP
jgi:predicted RNA-binding protein Jag